MRTFLHNITAARAFHALRALRGELISIPSLIATSPRWVLRPLRALRAPHAPRTPRTLRALRAPRAISVLCPLSSVLSLLSSVLCPLSSALSPLSSVLCPLSSVLCPLSSVLWTRALTPLIPTTLTALTTLAALIALATPTAPALRAAEPPSKPQLTERIATKLAPMKDLVEANDYAGILRLVDELLPSAAPDSFDLALLSQIRGQVLLNLKRLDDAIAPLERSLELGDRHAWFDTDATLNTLHTLSQLYFEKAAEGADTPARLRAHDLALARIERWLALSPKPSPDAHLYAATILYSAATLDPDKTDLEKIRLALSAVEAGLLLRDKPDEQSLILFVAASQQLGRLRDAADILEILVSLKPDSAIYWQQLFAAYTGLAADSALPPSEIRRLRFRALLTIERARARGFLSTPQDYFNTVALHSALDQHERAARLLEQGLADGTIASTRRNWELLSGAWQQQRAPARAIEALTRAAAALPDDGEIEYSLARLYYAADNPAETLAHLRAAVDRGNLATPGQTWFFLAYVAYELQFHDEAARSAETAATHPDVSQDDLARLTQAIRDAK